MNTYVTIQIIMYIIDVYKYISIASLDPRYFWKLYILISHFYIQEPDYRQRTCQYLKIKIYWNAFPDV